MQQLLLLPGQGNRQAMGEEADEGPAKVPPKKMSLGVVKLQGQPVGWSVGWLVSWLVGQGVGWSVGWLVTEPVATMSRHVKAPLVCHQFDAL